MPNVLVLAGTRPEAIKVAPVVRALRNSPRCSAMLCSTGQHREMLEQAFADFDLTLDEDLRVMSANQSLASLSARLFQSIDPLLERLKPDWLLVQGDTTTVMVASLCAFYRKIKIGHIEAGLRSFSKYAPFPEEINRKVAGVTADLHFAPTAGARDNLLREGITAEDIVVTGNTVIDSLLWIKEQVVNTPHILPAAVERHIGAGGKMVLITGHRRENFGRGFLDLCEAIKTLAHKYRDVLFVYPVHLNPNVQEPVHKLLVGIDNVMLLEPVSYKPFVALMNASTLVLTDSGGVQEEAPSLGKPVLVMREVTERMEGVEAGTALLLGTDVDKLVNGVSSLLDDEAFYRKMSRASNPYGDGLATERIVEALFKRSMH